MSCPADAAPATPFHDLDHYIALPRITDLTMSKDGTRLVATVSTLNRKATAERRALWAIDPAGQNQAYRLTRSAKGEGGAAFSVTGDLYFTSARPDADDESNDNPPALWMLPALGGEARIVHARKGGLGAVITADAAPVTLVTGGVLPGARDEESDATLRERRSEKKVNAILHDSYPVRFWDADLGPETPNIFAVEADPDAGMPSLPATVDQAPGLILRRLSTDFGRRINPGETQLSPDGEFLLVTVRHTQEAAEGYAEVWRIDIASGEQRVLASEESMEMHAGPISPDGRRAACVVATRSTPAQVMDHHLELIDTHTGERTPLAAGWDRWGSPVGWLPDGSGVVLTADDHGRGPVFVVDLATDTVRQVTQDDATYSAVQISPDGATLYALRATIDAPNHPVQIALSTGAITILPAPAPLPSVPGRVEDFTADASDGTRLRGWLCLPEGAGPDSPAPLLLWIHGGPLNSWNAWSWRWNPWLMVAQGYAVLLPDPALSTGYGVDFIQRGWGQWGAAPYTDLMDITDAVIAREDIDETRTAAMGGSFGGYMANWVAGHTDRFRAIVTHASLWALDQFGPTTDNSSYWHRELDATMAELHSPHRHVENITTPMLVVHGDKDYRVPIGEGLRLWYELLSRSGLRADADGTTPHRFLFFPDENHWILKPQHAKVWYGVVSDFLAHHLGGRPDGQPTALPEELGLTAPAQDDDPAPEATESEIPPAELVDNPEV